MLVLIGIGLAAGFVTAISPCVLPVLPIVLAGGATRRPYAIVAGLIATFTVSVLVAAWLLSLLSSQAAMHDIGWKLVVLTVAYAIGAAVPLLAIALGARRTVGSSSFLLTHAVSVRRVLGIAMAATAVAIVFNVPQHLQTAL